jgi:CheY-like chemotaxis protein
MKPKHILIVDDEASFTRLLKVNLEARTGHTVTTVNRAHEALAAARRQKPDLIFLDVIMPALDGGELAAQLQADPGLRGVPIVFLTATVSHHEAAKGVTNSGFGLLAKPVTLAELLACVAQHLGPSLPSASPKTSDGAGPPRPAP